MTNRFRRFSENSRDGKGWYEYFKDSAPHVFEAIDAYVRRRLRSILRRQNKRKGRAREMDHYRWPNAYFSAANTGTGQPSQTYQDH